LTDLQTPVSAPPAGWYPDPVDPAGRRWWSGENWTEHVAAAPEPVPAAEPALGPEDDLAYDPAADLARFSRDPLVSGRSSTLNASLTTIPRRVDPYRERDFLSGAALVAALVGLLGFPLSLLIGLPEIVQYAFGGVPFGFATFATVVALRTERRPTLAIIAAVLGLVNLVMVYALGASDLRASLAQAQEAAPTFSEVLEQAVVDSTNGLSMPAIAVSADCPDIPVPAAGELVDCTVTLDNGDSYLMHITSRDGLGAMDFVLVDEPIPPGSAGAPD